MKLLLDSHTYLWWLADNAKLSPTARAAIADPVNAVLVSAASIWEIEIKRVLGRLEAGDADFVAELEANDFGELPVRAAHASVAASVAVSPHGPVRSHAHRTRPGGGVGVRYDRSDLRRVRRGDVMVGGPARYGRRAAR